MAKEKIINTLGFHELGINMESVFHRMLSSFQMMSGRGVLEALVWELQAEEGSSFPLIALQ